MQLCDEEFDEGAQLAHPTTGRGGGTEISTEQQERKFKREASKSLQPQQSINQQKGAGEAGDHPGEGAPLSAFDRMDAVINEESWGNSAPLDLWRKWRPPLPCSPSTRLLVIQMALSSKGFSQPKVRVPFGSLQEALAGGWWGRAMFHVLLCHK